ncbi:hypothetical protein BDP27DRAFT_1213632 [Rhodocollybia butyracea]|uniref:CSC1/OSCA1-like 7TM region domain-containing protein n=1 Tax=Rhodocollybia butyracea TaxID=206335 RepID=A0A9P5PYK4_9AGAR|nr:hypothetical protein BDP27DRAFT_1213632 [Rhodocollybia butyracea]
MNGYDYLTHILARDSTIPEDWFTTSGGNTFIPSGTPSSSASSTTTSTITNSSSSDNADTKIITSSFPISTITQQSTTFTSFSQTIITTSSSSASTFSSATSATSSQSTSAAATASAIPAGQLASHSPVCIGNGVDSSSDGILSALLVPTIIGLIIWLIFALLRPKFRQVWAVREWFTHQKLRPKPLGNGFFAFLFPHVPLIPSMPSDMSDAGQSASIDAELFPSDEQLAQRALWISFLIVLGWSILGIAGALPLYLVSTPCLANQPPVSVHGGSYSALQDLSLERLLRSFDASGASSNALFAIQKRAIDDPQNLRARIIILTVFTIVLALFPALHRIIRELNRLVAFRTRWVEIKCQGMEMAWLSARKAPGFVGLGEKHIKDFILKTGLSSSLDKNGNGGSGNRNDSRTAGRNQSKHGTEREPLNDSEKATLEVDIQSLFSICDTQAIAHLIEERDEILENLEIAETRYIRSFRTTTPDPSLADWEPRAPEDPSRPHISRPRPLGIGNTRSRGRRSKNPAFAASSLAPTSFVAPSQYYRLKGVSGVSGGRFTEGSLYGKESSFTESIRSRTGGSRFQELSVNRESNVYGHLPLGSQVRVDEEGHIIPPAAGDSATSLPYPDPRRFGPNYAIEASDVDHDGLRTLEEEPEWMELSDATPDIASVDNGAPLTGIGTQSFKRPLKSETISSVRRETFPFRTNSNVVTGEVLVPPPHMRLQPAQPFVRPREGINYDDLGIVYGDITEWRSKLKAINLEITNAQRDSYNDIADGARIKGWLLVGRGLRFIPGVELIEGRAKEDIRWDVLQNERTMLDTAAMWACIILAAVLLATGLTAAVGLSLATAPDVAHFLPFLAPLLSDNVLGSGIATIFIPALAICIFILIALSFVRWISNVRGSVSVSGGRLLVFKTTFFFITVVVGLLLLTIGGLLFALEAFTTGTTPSKAVADGSIYMTVLATAIILQVAVIFPGLLLLQPFRLWRVVRAEKRAITPRERFRAVYPRTYDPSFALGACILAIVFASTFSLIFPLIGPAVVVFLFLTLIAHRFLIGYVYARTLSQTGGLLQIWLLRRFATLIAFQPIFLGLIFFTRKFWIEGGVLVGTGGAVIISVEVFATWRLRTPGRSSLSPITKDSLDTFWNTARASRRTIVDETSTSAGTGVPGGRVRGSMASVLEMMSLTLAVMPSSTSMRSPVPLQTETLDDLTATERAARTNPDAPPRLPPLPFTDHAEEMAGILYAPELIAPPPIIWLPNDSSGVARSEAVDLQKYHDLVVTLDVRTKDEAAAVLES